MSGTDRNHARPWLLKAANDLAAAETLKKARLLDVAAYHAQQAAEKALKGYLTSHGEIVPKTHDLALLIERCSGRQAEFSRLLDAAERLTPLATMYRYPEESDEATGQPDAADLDLAIGDAWEILEFVRSLVGLNIEPIDPISRGSET